MTTVLANTPPAAFRDRRRLISEAALLTSAVAGMWMPAGAGAEDLGSRGNTYALDVDAMQQMRSVIKRREATGDLQRYWKNYRERTLQAVREPAPLPIASSYQVRTLWNPAAFTVDADLRDHAGRVLASRGSVIKPLEVVRLTAALLFIDGRDEAQVRHAVLKAQREPTKIILTAGSPLALRQRFPAVHVAAAGGAQRTSALPVYFDQRGMLIGSLRHLYGLDISSVPALVRQQGSGLQVEFGLPASDPRGAARQLGCSPLNCAPVFDSLAHTDAGRTNLQMLATAAADAGQRSRTLGEVSA